MPCMAVILYRPTDLAGLENNGLRCDGSAVLCRCGRRRGMVE